MLLAAAKVAAVLVIMTTGGEYREMLRFEHAPDCKTAADTFNSYLPTVKEIVAKSKSSSLADKSIIRYVCVDGVLSEN